MPDWVRNKVVCNVKTAEKMLSNINGKFIVDFNKLIKMPEHQPDLNKPNPFLAEDNLSTEDMKKFKDNNWYDWSIKNWGCKWNAETNEVILDKEQDIAVLNFDTPYDRPKPIIEKLYKKTLKDRILWNCEYECDGEILNIYNKKNRFSKVKITPELQEYEDIIEKYLDAPEIEQEMEGEM